MSKKPLTLLQRTILSALRPSLLEPRASLSAETGRPGEATLRLTGSGVALALDGRGTSVVPFLETAPAKFWLSLSIALTVQRDTLEVVSVLLGVWRGEAATAAKELVVRAEWGPTGTPRKGGEHAQPHWHVHVPVAVAAILPGTTFADTVDEAPAEFEAEPAPAPTISRLPIEDIHLAMAARWHNDTKDAHTARCEPEQIAGWVGGCVAYVRQQLVYVLTGE